MNTILKEITNLELLNKKTPSVSSSNKLAEAQNNLCTLLLSQYSHNILK